MSRLVSGFMVVIHIISGSFSPRPLERWMLGLAPSPSWARMSALSFSAFGSTFSFSAYIWGTLRKWGNGHSSFSKYIPANKSDYWDGKGTPDNKTQLEPDDDAAHVLLGGAWRLPTFAEQEELKAQCEWTWTKENGISGYLVTSKVNHKSVFFPACGYSLGTEAGEVSVSYAGSFGLYWSSSLHLDFPDMAYCHLFHQDHKTVFFDLFYSRYIGASIRAVTE